MSDPPYSYWPPPRDWQNDPASPAPPSLTAWKISLAMLGMIGLLLVPAFVWAAGLGLDGGTLGDWLIFYAFMLAIPLGASLALLAPAIAVSPEWRIWVAILLFA